MNRNRDACKLVREWLKLIKKRLISSTFYPRNLSFRFELFWCKRDSLALSLVWRRRFSGRVTSSSDVGATPAPSYVRGLNSCRFTQDLLSFLTLKIYLLPFSGVCCPWLWILEHRRTEGKSKTPTRWFYRSYWKRKETGFALTAAQKVSKCWWI